MHNKINVSKSSKMSNNLERMEYLMFDGQAKCRNIKLFYSCTKIQIKHF